MYGETPESRFYKGLRILVRNMGPSSYLLEIMLNQPISKVLTQVHENLKQLYGEQLDKLILFGSQARGTAQPDSDIDILIVLKDVFNYSQESEKISQSIADLCLEYNVLISCAFATREQLENYNSGFFRNIRQDGLVI